MFSSHRSLHKKTPNKSIGRRDFILQLVEEYQSATNVEAQEQLVANLANFGYDPINFTFLYEAGAINVFLHALTIPNNNLIIFATAGLCNVCLDPILRLQIIEPNTISLVSKIFQSTENKEVAVNILTLFYYLLTGDKTLVARICTVDNLRKVCLLKKSSEQDLKNLCELFLQDFGTGTKNAAKKVVE